MRHLSGELLPAVACAVPCHRRDDAVLRRLDAAGPGARTGTLLLCIEARLRGRRGSRPIVARARVPVHRRLSGAGAGAAAAYTAERASGCSLLLAGDRPRGSPLPPIPAHEPLRP